MTLADFASARLVVEVASHVLGGDVLFASDNADVAAGDCRPVYRAAELVHLLAIHPSPADLRHLHQVRTVFGGTLRAAS